ncbi:MAG: 1-deoxy-D-xylulose-5-phosphate synthase [Clostridia bacterium]
MIEKINNPEDVKNLNIEQLNVLAKDVRQIILDTVLKNGGHLASSLGAVEVIIAMHYVFNAKYDKFIFDVGHQSYAHKILTGRKEQFSTLRTFGGIAGFPKRDESVYDIVNTGHASTSISIGDGLARAEELNKTSNNIVTLIGDGALTGGLCYEALNDISNIKAKQIIILNDNSMSISKSVGSTADYLLKLHNNTAYRNLKNLTVDVIDDFNLDEVGKVTKFVKKFRNSIKYFIQDGLPFTQYGIKYFGPIDGHDIKKLIEVLELAKKEEDSSAIVHIVTQKGRGYKESEQNPSKYHGYSTSAPSSNTFSNAVGNTLCELAKDDNQIVAVTAAMAEGTGVSKFAEDFSNRFYDVGIAEAHAVSMSAGMAIGGFKPYCVIYSTFIQRAYDQIIHDVALQNLNVKILLDRAGIVPDDGETHQGIFDISFMRPLPNFILLAPKDSVELANAIKWSSHNNAPMVIRYPKGEYPILEAEQKEFALNWQTLTEGNCNIKIVCVGAVMLQQALKAKAILLGKNIEIDVVSARCLKPLDSNFLNTLNNKTVFTLEDNVLEGGFGSSVLEYCAGKNIKCKVCNFAIENGIVPTGKVPQLLKFLNLDAESIALRIEEFLKRNN